MLHGSQDYGNPRKGDLTQWSWLDKTILVFDRSSSRILQPETWVFFAQISHDIYYFWHYPTLFSSILFRFSGRATEKVPIHAEVNLYTFSLRGNKTA